MKTIILSLCVLLPLSARAQTLTVKKVRGSQAIVEVGGGAQLQPGQIIALPADGSEDELTLNTDTRAPRRAHSAGITTAFYQNGSTDTGGFKTSNWSMNLLGRYGWNMGTFEAGPIGYLRMTDSGTGTNNVFGVGAFGDWNLTPNRPGNDLIYGIGGDFMYIMDTPANGGTKTTTMQFYPQGFLKWFLPRTTTALRASIGYDYQDGSAGSVKTKTQYVKLEAGFQVYF